MKILVAVASRHGSTHEIADALARELGTAGYDVDVQTLEDSPTVEGLSRGRHRERGVHGEMASTGGPVR